MAGPLACYDDVADAYGPCESHFSHIAVYYFCTGPDLEACGNAVDGFDGVYDSSSMVCNQLGCKDGGAHTADDPWVTQFEASGSESGSFFPSLSLEDGGLIAVAIIGLWALAFCVRAMMQVLEDS